MFCLLTFFFFNDTATTEIYPLSLYDALPISAGARRRSAWRRTRSHRAAGTPRPGARSDRKSTRLNSSHSQISYAVFCLKKINQPLVYETMSLTSCLKKSNQITLHVPLSYADT